LNTERPEPGENVCRETSPGTLAHKAKFCYTSPQSDLGHTATSRASILW